MAYTNPWQHIDALRQDAEELKTKVSDRGWKLAEPEDMFFVAFRLGRKDWAERERRVRALRSADLLEKIDTLEAEFREAQKSKAHPAPLPS